MNIKPMMVLLLSIVVNPISASDFGWRYEGIQGYVYTTQVENSIPLHRWSRVGAWHFATTNENVQSGSVYDGIQCYVLPHSPKIPLYRFRNPVTGDHFYTLYTNGANDDYNPGGRDSVIEGMEGFVAITQTPGTVPLYSYKKIERKGHWYWSYYAVEHGFITTNWNELGEGKDGWTYLGIRGYVMPYQSDDTVPLYRYANNAGDHFYTTNFNELGNGGSGYSYEGIQCYVFTSNDGALPLYRYCYGTGSFDESWKWFYTTNFSEKMLGSDRFNWVAPDCDVYPTQRTGTVPLYRFFSTTAGSHFYTTRPEEIGFPPVPTNTDMPPADPSGDPNYRESNTNQQSVLTSNQ